MATLVTAVAGNIASNAISAVVNPNTNSLGRQIRPMGHWSSTLLWISTAISVAVAAMAALASCISLSGSASAILMPAFAITMVLVSATTAIGAFYIGKFVPEFMFEENVHRFEDVVDDYRDVTHGIEEQAQRIEEASHEMQHMDDTLAVVTNQLRTSEIQLEQLIVSIEQRFSALAQHNQNFHAIVDELKSLLEGQVGSVDTLAKEFVAASTNMSDLKGRVKLFYIDMQKLRMKIEGEVKAISSFQEDTQKKEKEQFELIGSQFTQFDIRLQEIERGVKEYLIVLKNSLQDTSLQDYSREVKRTIEAITLRSSQQLQELGLIQNDLQTLSARFSEVNVAMEQISLRQIQILSSLQREEAKDKQVLEEINSFLELLKNHKLILHSEDEAQRTKDVLSEKGALTSYFNILFDQFKMIKDENDQIKNVVESLRTLLAHYEDENRKSTEVVRALEQVQRNFTS